MRAALLGVHIGAGTLALGLAAALLCRRGGWTGRTGLAYLAAVLVTGGTAAVLVAPGSTLPQPVRAVLLAVAVATAWAALTGRARAVRGLPGARRRLDGSVVSLVTAVAVVSAPVAVWVAVAVVGTACAEVAAARRRAPAPA